MTETLVLWDPALLGYDLGDHPLDPVRVELTVSLAGAVGARIPILRGHTVATRIRRRRA